MRAMMMIVRAGDEPIRQAAKAKYEKVKVKVDAFLEKLNEFYQTDVENFKKLLEESGFSLFKPFEPLELEDK